MTTSHVDLVVLSVTETKFVRQMFVCHSEFHCMLYHIIRYLYSLLRIIMYIIEIY